MSVQHYKQVPFTYGGGVEQINTAYPLFFISDIVFLFWALLYVNPGLHSGGIVFLCAHKKQMYILLDFCFLHT